VTRVYPSDHESVKRYLHDFRVAEDGKRWIARLRGEGKFRSSVFPEAGKPQVLVELIPLSEWKRPALPWRWLRALRVPYLAISLMPLLLVLGARLSAGAGTPFLLSALLFSCVLFIHLGCNLWSDYEDHLRGVDAPGQSGGSGVVSRLWIPAVHLRNAAAALFLLGCGLGLVLLTQLPADLVTQRLLWLGLLGALGAASYSGWPFHYKYFGLGEPIVFLLSGPLVTAGAAALYFPGTDDLLRFALLSLPLSFLVTLRLHSGNMQRIPFDTIAGVHTIARLGGFPWSKRSYAFLALVPYACVLLLALFGPAPRSALFSFVSLPLAAWALRPLPAAKGPLDPACAELKARASALHLSFGLLYTLGFLVA
jgi:1,4-dihydroxy-2-naphthoate octaprenyltransferase